MQKNSSKQAPSKKFSQIAEKTKSWYPVARNGWIIKFSIFDECNFLITVISQYTGQVIIRYFNDEDDACLFINFIQDLDAAQEIEM
jgi:hypothetical protein